MPRCAPSPGFPTGSPGIPPNELPAATIEFKYDGLSRLIERRVTRGVDPPDVEGYQWDGWKLIMIAKLNTDGTFHSRKWSCVWRPDVGSSLYARSDWMRAGGVGGVAWLQTGTVQNYSYGTGSSEAHVPLADHMGNVRHYYQFRASGKTVTGQLVASYEYDAFGREVRAWGLNTPATNQPPGLPASRPWADLLPFHYSSKLRDADSGFNYYGYRFYDPGAGRWLNRDPIGEEGGVNLYGFCQNQPTGLIDVFGGFPAGGYVGGPSGVASFNVDGHGSGKWYPTSPEEKERILAMQQAAIELVIPIEAFRQLMNGNIIAASGDLILGRLKFLKLATKLGTRRIADSGGKCCVAVEAQIVKMPLKKGRISPLAGCAPANSGGRLVHMSGASDDILASGKLGLPSNNYAGPAANSGRSGWGLTGRTGLSPSGTYGAVPIPVAGEAAFSKVTPVGIFTLWQRASGQQYTARGIMDLSTGAFTRKGVNWNQAAIYGGDAAVTVGVIGAGGYLWNEIHK